MSQGMHLRDLVRALGWSYATLWAIPNLMSELMWADGSFEESPLKKYEAEYWNVESLFTTVYKSCSFKPGSGYAGKALKQGQVLWLTGIDGLIHQTNNFNQAHFFKVAGIQTLLCIPCFNSVVELGSSTLVPRNENLLMQIRTFLSRMPVAHATATTQQLLLASAFTPIDGPQDLLSEGRSGSSDDASFNGEADHDVDSCSSFPRSAGASPSEDPKSGGHRFAATAGPDSNEKLDIGSRKNDFRSGYAQGPYSSKVSQQSLKVASKAASAVTNSVRQHYEHQQEEAGVDAGFQSSPFTSPRQLPLFNQLKYNQSISSSHSSSKGDSHDHRKGSSGKQQSNSDLSHSSASLGATGFEPWSATNQANYRRESVEKRYQSRSRANQVMLQRCIKMTHQISHFNSWVDDQRIIDKQDVPSLKNGAGAAATVETVAEVLSGHDEAAFHHMLAERKRRLKQKENFTALRALIPFVSKMDRASTLEDAINYVIQLKARVTKLESLNKALQAEIPQNQNLALTQRKRSKS